jgi:hypothetical protein
VSVSPRLLDPVNLLDLRFGFANGTLGGLWGMAAVIDAEGKYLVPGLADMHVHFNRREHERDLLLYVANGVTTVRNMHAATTVPIVRWRDEIAAGTRVGPTVFTTGPTVRSLAGTPGLEWTIRRHQAERYDFIKVYSDLPADAYRRLTARARR